MTVYNHVGIIRGILVSSCIWANNLEEHGWMGAVVKQEKQSACCLWVLVSRHRALLLWCLSLFCDEMPRITPAPRRLFCSLCCPIEVEKEIASVCLACQNYESVPLLSGLGIIFKRSTAGLICNMEVLRQKRRVISWWSLPAHCWLLASLLWAWLSVSLLRNGGLSHNYYIDRPFGLTKMAAN